MHKCMRARAEARGGWRLSREPSGCRRVPQTPSRESRTNPRCSSAASASALLPCSAAAARALDAVRRPAGSRCRRPSPVKSPSWVTGASVSPALRRPGCFTGPFLTSRTEGRGRARPSDPSPALAGAEVRAEEPGPASQGHFRAAGDTSPHRSGTEAGVLPTPPERHLHFPPLQSRRKEPFWAGDEPD